LLGEIFAKVGNFTRGCAQHDDMATIVFHWAADS
jgi:hypothetical protein